MAEIQVKRQLVVGLDFDGVLHDYKNPIPGMTMGEPLPGAVEGVGQLLKEGHTVVIFTERGNSANHVLKWLLYWGFPILPITNVKKGFDVIVDDRAQRFVRWPLTLELGADMVSTVEKRDNLPLLEPGSTPGGSTEP